jgi:dTDP-4-dehydrorhamnose 3,5-epimerase
MLFKATPLPGAMVIELDRREDERGFFARAWCAREFADHGIDDTWVQSNISHNTHAGTLRGLHVRRPPREEAKLVRCIRGAIHDVLVDLRRASPTYREHVSIVLSADNGLALYVPKGVAHGFQTLEDDTDVLYLMSDYHSAEHESGVRWNDPAFAIAWPEAERRIMSARDASYADFEGR